MSTSAVGVQNERAPGFWGSTNGKKAVMAVTGAILFIFVVGHLAGNLQVFEGPAKLNAYGKLPARALASCCGRYASSCSSA